MTSRERIAATLNFEKPDRLPIIEWAPHWNLTVDRWKLEGLPENVNGPIEINEYFGLDAHWEIGIPAHAPGCPTPAGHGKPMIRTESDYEAALPFLYPMPDDSIFESAARYQERGGAVWFWFVGSFWYPRTLFGIEEQFYAFYDQPKLMRRMNDDLLQFLFRVTDRICEFFLPDFMAFGEDMSYNHGPMLSKPMFDEHIAPFYHEAVPFLKSKGIKIIVDSDGLVDDPVDWYAEVGCEGFLPLEKQAGVDLAKYRRKRPRFLFIGGFDKMCMHKGEEALRWEFERLLPVMRQGGFIPSVDHQTPPEVSLEDYRLYVTLLKEYCARAVDEWTGPSSSLAEKKDVIPSPLAGEG